MSIHVLYWEIVRSCHLVPVVGGSAASLHDHVDVRSEHFAEARDVNSVIGKLANAVAHPVDPSRAKIPSVAAR